MLYCKDNKANTEAIMKTILLTAALLLATTSVNASEWQASCNSKYSNWFGKYTFTVKLGEVGGCKSDKKPKRYANSGWDWSERSEVLTKNKKMFGKWEYSATIDIDRNCKPAYRNTLFQVHSGGSGTPPSWIGINGDNKFRTNLPNGQTNFNVPLEPFELTAKIDATNKEVKVDYFVDDKFVVSTHHVAESTYNDLFFKFGIYRVNANCDIKQTYRKVKLKRVK